MPIHEATPILPLFIIIPYLELCNPFVAVPCFDEALVISTSHP